jgi:hypothetical protein
MESPYSFRHKIGLAAIETAAEGRRTCEKRRFVL